MLEQESSNTQHSSEGGSGNASGQRRRNRRPNRRRPDNRKPEDGHQSQQTDKTQPVQQVTDQSGKERHPRETRHHNPPGRQAQNDRPKDQGEVQRVQRPQPEPAQQAQTEKQSDEQSHRSNRNKRRRPDRNQKPQGNQAEVQAPQADKPSAPSQQSMPTQPAATTSEAGAKSNRPAAENRQPGGRGNRKDKAEREPQGSVLQRRLQREAKAKSETEGDDFVATVTPINVNSVDAYVSQLRGWQREVVNKLRSIIRSQAPDAQEGILWSQPVYSGNGPVVYIKAFSDHVNLGFWRGNELDDEAGRLSGDLPTMRHVTIKHVNEMDKELFEAYVRKAFKLDRDKGDATA